MKWSLSQYNTFQRCQRQWYYQYVYASSRAKDQGRREAYHLAKLTNLKAWRGKIVDDVISNVVVPAINREERISLPVAREAAWTRFSRQRELGMRPGPVNDGEFRGFLEVQCGVPPAPSDFDEAWADVETALRNFFNCSFVWKALRKADTCRTQRRIPFSLDIASLIAVPDVICFYSGCAPLIIDWKVQSNPVRNYWLQLATYALALTRCTPHRDWPTLPEGLGPMDVELAEIQLLADDVRTHTVTSEELEELEEMIICSAVEISLARRGKSSKDLAAEDFSTARSPGVCHYCSFKELCWVMNP